MNPNIHWPDETLPVQIYCALGVLTRLEMIATDGLLAIPRTGLGVGGFLLGKRRNGGIEILGTAEISCSHALGPAFVLTSEEIAASLEFAADATERVGWYCSKPATSKAHNPNATEHDQALFNTLCPDPWQVMLLIRPSMGKTTTAVFGLRAPGDAGSALLMGTPKELAWQELAAFQELAPAPEPPESEPPEDRLEAIRPVEFTPLDTPVPMPQTGTLFGIPDAAPEETKGSRWPKRLLIAAILLALLSAAAFFTRSYWMPNTPIALIASSDWTGRVSFVWNGEALPDQDQATLVIDDGVKPLHTIHLNRESLRQGSYQYLCRPGTVNATLLAGGLSATVTINVKPRRSRESWLPEMSAPP